MDKEEYFRRLDALEDSSDEEEEKSNARQVLNNIKPHTIAHASASSSFSSFTESIAKNRSQKAAFTHRLPEPRTKSDPVPGTNSSGEFHRKLTSLLRHNISNEDVIEETILESPQLLPRSSSEKPHFFTEVAQKQAATPNIGTDLVMNNSRGIRSMLSKPSKRKKKDSSMILAPEAERIFAGQTLFYIPTDDIAPIRKARINRAKKYGATWAKEWTSKITHVVVNKNIQYEEVMAYLKHLTNSDAFPASVIIVNEDYPIECMSFGSLLDPKQKCYLVEKPGSEPEIEDEQQPGSELTGFQNSGKPLELKQVKSNKLDGFRTKGVPTPSQISIVSDHGDDDTSPGVWLPKDSRDGGELVKSPQETSPSHSDLVSFRPLDELDEMIEIARDLKGLPLEEFDEESDRPSSSEGPEGYDSDEEEEASRARKRKYSKKISGPENAKATFDQSNFSCIRGGTGITLATNPNQETIALFQEMCDHYERNKDTWRVRAYQKIIGILKKQTTKISTFAEAKSLPGFGDRLATKLEEIVLTHRLRRLDNAKLEDGDKILQLFLGIYGAGPAQSTKWMLQGYRTLEELKTKAHLTESQKIGIEHYNDFSTRIPRDEVTALGEIVKSAAAKVDASVECIIGGSYRRGAVTSGDIDFIITKDGTQTEEQLIPFLRKLTDTLTKDGFLVAALAVGGSKWHGACILPGTEKPLWRRIDFLLVPASQLGAALIYFTGDDIFNRSIRLLSSKKGLRLNQRGLYKDVMRGPQRKKLNRGELVEGRDESKIFEKLGVPWRKPTDRICH